MIYIHCFFQKKYYFYSTWTKNIIIKNKKKEKVKTRIDRILTFQEYQSLINASKKSNLPYLADIIEFAYITAMRFGEITKLEVSDTDFQNKLANLRDTKNGEDRVVPLNNRAVEICLRYLF